MGHSIHSIAGYKVRIFLFDHWSKYWGEDFETSCILFFLYLQLIVLLLLAWLKTYHMCHLWTHLLSMLRTLGPMMEGLSM